MKNAKKGFTLVELMIVVAIIGVLATTLLPVLNGAQERARDGGRVASLNNIGAALATYNSDAGQFPQATAVVGTADTGNLNCLSSAAGVTAGDLALLLKGGNAPMDPQRTSIAGNCAVAGSYAYFPLQKGAIDKSSYMLIADMETAKKANYNYCDATGVTIKAAGNGLGNGLVANTKYEDLVGTAAPILITPLTAEPGTNKKCSTFVLVN